MRRMLLLLLGAAAPLAAQLPEFYRQVDRVFWVVDDIDRTVAGWRKLGMIEARDVAAPEAGVRWSVGRLGDTTVDFIQPLDAKSAFAAFRKQHGQGVIALLHRAPDRASLEREIARLKAAKVAVLDRQKGYVLFDTAAEGKYALGVFVAGALPDAPAAKPDVKKLSQYAFVARDLERVSRYWAGLGFPAMDFTHPPLWDLIYHGAPGKFDAILGWQRHGKIVYEWIQPTAGPTTYLDHAAKHGEGLHHIAFAVSDLEREKRVWTEAGYPTSQSGAWGERDKPGYGRFAYQDVHAIGGTEVELLWNFR
jgi:methylmalonyl-CoA/ethylmalonyl-CoA epimerase